MLKLILKETEISERNIDFLKLSPICNEVGKIFGTDYLESIDIDFLINLYFLNKDNFDSNESKFELIRPNLENYNVSAEEIVEVTKVNIYEGGFPSYSESRRFVEKVMKESSRTGDFEYYNDLSYYDSDVQDEDYQSVRFHVN